MNKQSRVIFAKELKAYFETPVAAVFLVVFLLLNGILTFYVGQFYQYGNASLESFFQWHPWLYLFLMPALTMRLWAEEKHAATLELLMTLPVKPWEVVLGKFMAAWVFALLALVASFPMWMTVSYLGDPDHGIIIASYLASFLLAGEFIAIGLCISALSQSQVIAFILAMIISFLCMMSGFPMVLGFFEALHMPQWFLDLLSNFSLVTNFEEMMNGLISVRSLIYTVSVILFWVGLNIYLIHRQTIFSLPKLHQRGLIIGMIILFFAVNIISSTLFFRWKMDFTEDKHYQLSEQTIDILDKLNEPMILRFYFSNKLVNGIPHLKNYANRVKQFLLDYESHSNGNIQIEWIDPEPFSDEEDQALAYGIKPVPLDAQGNKAYFGLVATNPVDDMRVIPVFTFEREKFTEYELTRIIYDLSHPKKNKLAIISSLPIGEQNFMGMNLPGIKGSRAWLVIQQLQQNFDVTFLEKEAVQIPDDVNLLMVVQPDKTMNNRLLMAIDEFVISGKQAIFFLDPHAESKGGTISSDTGFDSRFDPLLQSWGINVSREWIVADRLAARKVKEAEIKSQVDYLAWLNMRQDNLNSDELVTSHLKTINLASTGFIEIIPQAKTQLIPLITSNKQSMAIDVNKIKGQPNPLRLLAEFHSQEKNFILAARILGDAKSAYGNNQTGNINIAVIADTDLLKNEQWAEVELFDNYQIVKPMADNNSFIVNLADYLSSGTQLITLRGRGTLIRPFTKVEMIKRISEEGYLSKQQELQTRLTQTEKRLAQLQKQAQQGNQLAYANEQKQEIRQFSDEMIRVRKELKNVQKQLYEQIESLGSWLKFINILLMPLIISASAAFWFYRRYHRAR